MNMELLPFCIKAMVWRGSKKTSNLGERSWMKNLLFDISRFFSKLPAVSLEAVAAGAAVGAGRLL